MGLVTHWGGISIKRDVRALLAITVLLALLGGVSMGALAGARRTQSSYPRFLRASQASTMAVDPGPYDPVADATIAAFPEVVRSATYVAFLTAPLVNDRPDFNQDFETLGTPNGRFFTMDRFAPTQGRLPSVDRADEVAVNEEAADQYGYHVGQQLDLGTYSDDQSSSETFFEDPPAPLIRTHATIVGVGLFTDEVVQDDTNRFPLLLVTPAFTRAASAYATYAWQGLTLRNGDADVPSIKARYLALTDPGTPQFFRVTSVDTFHAQQAVRPASLALAAFGAIAGAAAVVLVGQATSRHLRRARPDQEVLRSFGASPRSLLTAGLVGPFLALLAGGLLAIAVAIAGSGFMPLGATRRVEVSPGVSADWAVLGVGGALLFGLLASAAVVIAARSLPHRRAAKTGGQRQSRLVQLASRSGAAPPAVTGLRMAFEQSSGPTSVPVRSVMVAAATAITLIVATLTFGASFRTLLHSPVLYGWNWDSTIFDQGGYGSMNLDEAHRLFDTAPEISGWSGAFFGADSIDGRNLPLLGMEVSSSVSPPLLSGRMIASDQEVVLGSATARTLGKHPGDNVRIGVGSKLTTLRVVGTATFPTIGISHGAHTSLGVGALVVPSLIPGYDRRAPQGAPTARGGPPAIFVRFKPGTDDKAARALVAKAADVVGQYPGSAVVLGPQRPAEIVNSTGVGAAPARLALGLGGAAAVSLAIALGASVRRRRRELALLRSLGFTRRQLGVSVAWQATATIGIGLLVGVPLGIALGRTLWGAFAAQLDVVARAMTPFGPLLAVMVGALAIANLGAMIPARMARRVKPAILLRAE